MNFNFHTKLINLFLKSYVRKYQEKSIEQVLKNSLQIIEIQNIEELKNRTTKFAAQDGGFVDRASKSDLYYSLFGMFVAEALNLNNCSENLKTYIKNIDYSKHCDGVYLFCLSILHSRLFSNGKGNKIIQQKVKYQLAQPNVNADYTMFLGILSLFYSKDYFYIFKLLRKINKLDDKVDLPCPVLAAKAVVLKASGKNIDQIQKKIMTFYRGDGSFSATKNAPIGDLLSTAVALYALKFIDADIRLIKPECFDYVGLLYEKGSFAATGLDSDTDIEYTFYGLLALGALA